MLMRFSDNPDPQSRAMTTPGMENKVMHSNVTIRDTEIMMSDGRSEGEEGKFDGFTLTLNVKADEADKIFAGLGEGGQVQMPLTETFFADKFGMLADKFGVSWMVLAAKPMM
jgi:PhnB protein